jgi:hypothetical protein
MCGCACAEFGRLHFHVEIIIYMVYGASSLLSLCLLFQGSKVFGNSKTLQRAGLGQVSEVFAQDKAELSSRGRWLAAVRLPGNIGLYVVLDLVLVSWEILRNIDVGIFLLYCDLNGAGG